MNGGDPHDAATPPPLPPRLPAKRGFPTRAIVALPVLVVALAGGGFVLWHRHQFAFPEGYRNRPTAGWGVRAGEEEFDRANALIDDFATTNAFGNSAEAVQLAARFSAAFKAAREESFSHGSGVELLDHTKGEFLTYCELHRRECAFLVHVPELRRFDRNVMESVDARKGLAQLAWLTAQRCVKEQDAGGPQMELALGLRGLSQYGPIQLGWYDERAVAPSDGLVKYLDDGAQTHFLWTFFAPEEQERSETMPDKEFATGVVHDVPADLKATLLADAEALALWEDITPLARNEWICWVEDAKQDATRAKRIGRVRDDLRAGKRRPCCWPGCPHRGNRRSYVAAKKR